MFTVYDDEGFVVMTTDNEGEADFFAWVHDGYYIEENRKRGIKNE